eukprot:2233574-Lingulodinium_polyedra.AAC.1
MLAKIAPRLGRNCRPPAELRERLQGLAKVLVDHQLLAPPDLQDLQLLLGALSNAAACDKEAGGTGRRVPGRNLAASPAVGAVELQILAAAVRQGRQAASGGAQPGQHHPGGIPRSGKAGVHIERSG